AVGGRRAHLAPHLAVPAVGAAAEVLPGDDAAPLHRGEGGVEAVAVGRGGAAGLLGAVGRQPLGRDLPGSRAGPPAALVLGVLGRPLDDVLLAVEPLAHGAGDVLADVVRNVVAHDGLPSDRHRRNHATWRRPRQSW